MYCSPYIPRVAPAATKDPKQPVIASWIASFDVNGTPFWTNSVNRETINLQQAPHEKSVQKRVVVRLFNV